jgi:hypothetical protein
MKVTLFVTFAMHDRHRHEDFAALQPLMLAEAELIAEQSRLIQLAAVAPANVLSIIEDP